MKRILYIIIVILTTVVTAKAAEADTANAAKPAVAAEKSVAVSAQEFFEAGNKAYRSLDYTQAVLNYEKARKLAPMNDDISHNLELARLKTIDRMPSEGEMFFVRWYKGMVMSLTIDQWGYVALTAFALSLILFLCYLFLSNTMVRRLSFYASAFLLVTYIFTNLMAWQRRHILLTHDTAIITSVMVTVRSSPTLKSPETCIIHEGTFVRITDNEMATGALKDGKGKGWLAIELSDGREGWIEACSVEEI